MDDITTRMCRDTVVPFQIFLFQPDKHKIPTHIYFYSLWLHCPFADRVLLEAGDMLETLVVFVTVM